MAYYPKSQIKTNLYTNGGEFTLIQNQTSNQSGDYIGYYFKTSTGQTFTGKSPSDIPNKPLYPSQPIAFAENSILDLGPSLITYNYDQLDFSFTSANSINTSQTRTIPQHSITLPTAEDKKRGYFMRYFCKKNNELIYYETSKNDYDRTKNQDSTMAYDLYSVLALQWSFTGDPSQVANFNISSITRASSLNNWTGFIQYFKGNYTQYLGS